CFVPGERELPGQQILPARSRRTAAGTILGAATSMNPTFDPIWDWLWPDSVYVLLKPLGEVVTGGILVLAIIGLIGLARLASGTGGQRLGVLGLGASGVVLLLALVPIGLALALVVAGLTFWTYRGVEKATPGRILTVLLLRLGALCVAFLL